MIKNVIYDERPSREGLPRFKRSEAIGEARQLSTGNRVSERKTISSMLPCAAILQHVSKYRYRYIDRVAGYYSPSYRRRIQYYTSASSCRNGKRVRADGPIAELGGWPKTCGQRK